MKKEVKITPSLPALPLTPKIISFDRIGILGFLSGRCDSLWTGNLRSGVFLLVGKEEEGGREREPRGIAWIGGRGLIFIVFCPRCQFEVQARIYFRGGWVKGLFFWFFGVRLRGMIRVRTGGYFP